jgi:release factor H-coupled RctB family protein
MLTRFIFALNSNHADEKIVPITYSDVASLQKGMEKVLSKFKGRTSKNSQFYVKGKKIFDYEKDHKFPDETLVLICGNKEEPIAHGSSSLASASLSSSVTFLHDKSFVDQKAMDQLKFSAQLPGMITCVGMPDLHPGGGKYPVGAAFYGTVMYPELVGQDIGCGMSLFRLETTSDLSDRQLKKVAEQLSHSGFPGKGKEEEDFSSREKTHRSLLEKHSSVFGTIGGGNHFAELCIMIDLRKKSFSGMFDMKSAFLLVHSGSRTLGESILDLYRKKEKNEKEYKILHDLALEWASASRQEIARTFAKSCNIHLSEKILDICHNCCVEKNGNILHRKGAAPTDKGLVAIPGSRGTFTYIVLPVEDEKIQEKCAWSIAHGAGRLVSRKEIQEKLERKYSAKEGVETLSRTEFGGYVVYNDRKILYQEAPEAYKDIDDIVLDLEAAGIIEVVAVLKPLVTCKL